MSKPRRPLSVPYSSEDNPVFLLSRLGAVTRSRLADSLADFDLTPRQFVVLRTLSRSDGLAQTELSERLGIDTSSIVHIVDECESSGLLDRRRRSDDRRRYALSLTDPGRARLEAAQRSVDEFSADLLAPLDKTDQDKLGSLLAALAAAHRPSEKGRASVAG